MQLQSYSNEVVERTCFAGVGWGQMIFNSYPRTVTAALRLYTILQKVRAIDHVFEPLELIHSLGLFVHLNT